MGKPLAFDICCGLGGWAEGLLAEDYDVVGFDIERHEYGDEKYPAQLVLQDVLTLHGSQFRNATLIVASPPCQFFSYTGMPWTRAKKLAADVRSDPVRLEKELALFNACFRIQREASEAAGHHIPMVVENVNKAQAWVGRAKWHFGSYYLWGDVPALMPMARSLKVPGFRFDGSGGSFQSASVEATKVPSASGRRTDPGNGVRFTSRDCGVENKQPVWFNDDRRRAEKCGGDWFGSGVDCSLMRRMSSKSSARKAASAQIAKIPFALSRYIAQVFKPARNEAAA